MRLEEIFRYQNDSLFDSRTSGFRFQHRVLKQIIKSLEQEKRGYLERIKVINSYIPELQSWLSGIESKICQNCDGIGKIRIRIFEDESRTEICNICKGTGVASSFQKKESKA